ANLTPQYKEAEKRYKETKTISEKIILLEEMLAVIPKHKGTEKLQKEIKTKLSKLKKQTDKKSHPSKRGPTYFILKEEAGQVILIGHPNTGKSQLLASLTNANPVVASYPFTTRMTQQGMMPFKNIKIQLVDSPPISKSFMEIWMPSIIRYADIVLLIADLSSPDLIDQIQDIIDILDKRNIILSGKSSEISTQEEKLIKKTIIVCNKDETPDAKESFKIISELYNERFPLVNVSASENKNLDILKEKIYKNLNILRIFSKMPGKKADLNEPFVFKKGISLIEVAKSIHKDFEKNFKFARIWGTGKYDGQKVQKDYIVQDEDIIEFHI
ncbi:GTPase, partial [candidate division KSB1 bacterium]